MYTCGIVEDEYLALKLLLNYVERFPGLEVRWTVETATCSPGLPLVDIVFLDLLDIPSASLFATSEGIKEFASCFPAVIITTAYNRKQVESLGIEYAAILTKPYTYEDFAKALEGCLVTKA